MRMTQSAIVFSDYGRTIPAFSGGGGDGFCFHKIPHKPWVFSLAEVMARLLEVNERLWAICVRFSAKSSSRSRRPAKPFPFCNSVNIFVSVPDPDSIFR